LQTLWESSPKAIKLIPDFGKAIDNLRVQRLLGINRTDGKATLETIPSDKDRSMFSCVKYQFFLDAPFEISQKCCSVMKKSPAHSYMRKTGRHPMMAQLASESRLRTQQWLKNGCNGFDMKQPVSNPMAFWTENDVLMYIYLNKIPIAKVYGDVIIDSGGEIEGQMSLAEYGLFEIENPTFRTTGVSRTGCMFCGFGCHLEKGEGRFEKMRKTHPKQYEYIMKSRDKGGLGYKEIIDWINEHGNFHIKY